MSPALTLAHERSQISKWSRDDLEDKYLRSYEENLNLKRKNNVLEDKIKKMAVKMVKVMGHPPSNEKDEEKLEMEKQIHFLKERLKAAHFQLNTYAKTPITLATFRSNAAMSHTRSASRGTSALEIRPKPHTLVRTVVDREAIDEAVREQSLAYEKTIADLRARLQDQEAIEDEALRMKLQSSFDQKALVQESVDVIRLQRQLREKSSELAQIQAKYQSIEQDLRVLKTTHDGVLREFDDLNTRLRTEQNLNGQLQGRLQSLETTQSTNTMQLQFQVDSLQRENNLLKTSNEQLIAKTFDPEREQQRQVTEQGLRARVAQLEGMVKADMIAKNEFVENLAREYSEREQAQRELTQLRSSMIALKSENERLQGQINRISKEHGVEFSELEDALAAIKQRKQFGEQKRLSEAPDFITPHENPETEDLQLQLANLQATYKDCAQELEKTRNMLLSQHKINADCLAEIETVSKNATSNKREYEERLTTMVDTLNARAERIQQLERQLQDIVYGTKTKLLEMPSDLAPGELDLSRLEPGQNVVEIKIGQVTLTDKALQYMQSREPLTFLSLEFFDFDFQFSQIVKGAIIADLQFRSRYFVTVSELFFQYLQTSHAVLELHQAHGVSYTSWGRGQIFMRDALNKQGVWHGTLELLGTNGQAIGAKLATVDFSVRFFVPMEQAFKHYKDRAKALVYLSEGADTKGDSAAIEDRTNQLQISVHRCRDLRSRMPGSPLPSCYCVYQFYDFPDHDTAIFRSNANPQFADTQVWTVPIGQDLDSFLRKQVFRILVLDDAASQEDLAYLGSVEVPLLPLAHNKPIRGSFPVRLQDEIYGSMDISLTWKFDYIAPKAHLSVPTPTDLPADNDIPQNMLQMMDDVEETLTAPSVAVTLPTVLPRKTEKAYAAPDVTTEVVVTREQALSNRQPFDKRDSHTIARAESTTPHAEERRAPQLRSDVTEPIAVPSRPVIGVRTQLPALPSIVKQTISSQEEVITATTVETKETTTVAGLPPLGPPKPLPRKPKVTWKNGETRSESPDGDNDDVPEAGSSEESDDGLDVVSAAGANETAKLALAPQPIKSTDAPTVTIRIHAVWCPAGSPLLTDDAIENLFVEWTFLDFPTDQCETPLMTVARPTQPNQRSSFDFEQNYLLDSLPRRSLFKSMLRNDPRITFTLVGEPPDQDSSVEDTDVGTAEADLTGMTEHGKDLVNVDIPVLADNDELVAYLNVTVVGSKAAESVLLS